VVLTEGLRWVEVRRRVTGNNGRRRRRVGLRGKVDAEAIRASGHRGLRGTAAAFRWPECRRVAGKWLESFHAMMWCWWCAWQGLRGGRASGRWRDRAAEELELIDTMVQAARVRESEIGRVCEPQWVAAVLLEHWITTAGRSCGGAPARSSAREEGR
jgi:hypothetical protein